MLHTMTSKYQTNWKRFRSWCFLTFTEEGLRRRRYGR